MSEQDRIYLRHLYAMFIFNGLLSRLNPQELNADKVWQFVDEVIEASESKPVEEGIVSIKKRRSKQ